MHIIHIKTRAKLNPRDTQQMQKNNKITICTLAYAQMNTQTQTVLTRANSWRKTNKHTHTQSQDTPSAHGCSRRQMFPGRPDAPPPQMLQWHRNGPPPAPPPPLLRAPPECRPDSGPAHEGLSHRTNEAGLCRCCLLLDRCPTHWLPGEPGACEGQGGARR